jgi:hypothetical protein
MNASNYYLRSNDSSATWVDINASLLSHTSSLRAPIFYDLNNTGYYVDPASTSALFDLTLIGASNKYLYINPGNGYEAMVRYNGGSGSGWYVGKRTANQVVSTADFHFYSEAAGATIAGIDTSGNVFASGSFRAPIFYDSNDTGYYVDPAGTTQLSYVLANNWFRPQGDTGLYFQTYGYGLWAPQSGGNQYGNVTTYAVGRNSWTGYGLGSRITLMTDTNNGGVTTGIHDSAVGWYWRYYYDSYFSVDRGYSIFANSARAPIFYDSDNTGYYVDPASTSELNKVYYNSNMVSRNYGIGQVGLYDSFRYQAVFSMGESYILPANGTGTGNLYGIAWSHPNAGGVASNLASHGMLILENGGFQGAWGGGRLVTPADIRGTIFYDYNNTSYYLDPASSSSLNNATVYGTWYFQSNLGGTSGSLSNPPLQAYATGGNSAFMSFHRGGNYAVNMGLDSDNVLRIGGWSAPANRFQMDMSGNLTMAGNVTAFSDERLKKDWAELSDDFVERLARIKSGTYTRIDSGERQMGVSAQDFRDFGPEAVSEDASGTLSLAYGNAALAACVELAKSVVALRAELNALRAH